MFPTLPCASPPGSTVNDLVVSLIGGGLRHYLEHHGELPTDSTKDLTDLNRHVPAALLAAAARMISTVDYRVLFDPPSNSACGIMRCCQ